MCGLWPGQGRHAPATREGIGRRTGSRSGPDQRTKAGTSNESLTVMGLPEAPGGGNISA